LNIIRAGKKRPARRDAEAASAMEAKVRKLLVSLILPRRLFVASILLAGGGVIYLIAVVLLPLERTGGALPEAVLGTTEAGGADTRTHREQPLTFYLEGIRNRNIFEMKAVRAKEAAAAAVDLFKDLSLQGVIAGNPPQAIIKDKSSGSTYFLYTGDKIGDMNVQSVSEGKVVVEHKGELYEMHL